MAYGRLETDGPPPLPAPKPAATAALEDSKSISQADRGTVLWFTIGYFVIGIASLAILWVSPLEDYLKVIGNIFGYGVVTALLARRKGYSIFAWYLTGGVLGLVALSFLPYTQRHDQKGSRRRRWKIIGNIAGLLVSAAVILGIVGLFYGMYEETRVHYAVADGDLGKVIALVEKSPTLAARAERKHGATPLHIAATRADLEIVRYLLSRQVSADARDFNGCTPLHYVPLAWEQNFPIQVVELLVAHGARVDSRDSNGNTPLHAAVFYGHVGAAYALLSAHANINAVNVNGETPLNSICLPLVGRIRGEYPDDTRDKMERNNRMVDLLLSCGADPTISDNDGLSPIHKLLETDMPHDVKLEFAGKILGALKNIDIKDNEGSTPLHLAVAAGDQDLAILFFQYGASLDLANRRGETPLSIARDRHPEIATILETLRANASRQSEQVEKKTGEGPGKEKAARVTEALAATEDKARPDTGPSSLEWEAARRAVVVKGVIRQANGRDIATINGQLLGVGDFFSVIHDNKIYHWQVTEITNRQVKFAKIAWENLQNSATRVEKSD